MKTISILCIYCLISLLTSAQPGTLDRSFADTGVAILQLNAGTLEALVLQSNGRIIAGGGFIKTTSGGSTLVGYLPSGILDSSFGDEGISFINDLSDVASIAILDNDNMITVNSFSAANDIILSKYLSNGKLDSVFGSNGQIHQSFSGVDAITPAKIKVQQDGKIVIAGAAEFIDGEGAYEPQIFIARFSADGSVDKSFGGKGYVLLKGKIANALMIQPDGKIIIGGNTGVMESCITARYLPDGSLDENYGVNGVVTTRLDHHTSYINALALQSDGKIIAVGTKDDDDGNMLAVRYLPDGSIDKSFGREGFANPVFENGSEATSVLLQSDGKIILSGLSNFSNFAMARLDSNGIVDSSFGENGLVVTEILSDDRSTASVLQPDGKIILGGTDYTTNFALARYNNDIQNKTPIARIKKWLIHHILHWQNLQALTNASYYTIEQSNSVTKGFTQIAKVNSSSTNNIYNYTLPAAPNNNLQSINYYRINAMSNNGNIIASAVISDAEAEDATTLSVYPNPVKDVLHIKGLDGTINYQAKIMNEKGNVVLTTTINKNSVYDFNVQNLNKGIYYLNLVALNSRTITVKFVKE